MSARQSIRQTAYEPHLYEPTVPHVTGRQLPGYGYGVDKVRSRNKKRVSRVQVISHGLIIMAVVFGLLHSLWALGTGLVKLTRLVDLQAGVNRYYEDTRTENAALRERISIYSSPAGVEELARNQLQMTGQDEILVRFR